MSLRAVVSVVAVSVGLAVLGGASAHAHSANAASIEGTWFVESDSSVVSFLPGGVMLTSNPPLELTNSGAQRYNTPGFGAWASLGSGRHAFTVTYVQTDDRGAPVRRMLLEGTATLEDNGEHFVAQFQVRGLMPNGQELFTSEPISAAGRRVHAPEVASALGAASPLR